MAKERLTLYDRYGNVIEYDISSASVTIDAEGKSLDIKLSEIATALLQAVTEVTFNDTAHNRDGGKINIGSQMQSDWSESSPTYPTYIRNKPDLARVAISGDYNDLQHKPTIPAGIIADSELSDTSENAVQNKVVKAAIDSLQSALNNLIGSGNVQGAIDTFNEVKAFLEGINNQETLAAKLALLVPQSRTINSKPLTGNITIGINDIDGLAAAIANAGSGAVSVTTNQDGTFTIHVGETDYTINLNHVHPQYLNIDDIDEHITAGSNVTITKDSQTGVLVISASGSSSGSQVQANWNESDSTSAAYIQNKPTIPTVPTNVSSFTNDANYLKFQLCADAAAYNAIPTKDSGTLYLIPES